MSSIYCGKMKTLDNEIKKKTTERRKMQKKDDTKTKTKKANQIINMTARKIGTGKFLTGTFLLKVCQRRSQTIGKLNSRINNCTV